MAGGRVCVLTSRGLHRRLDPFKARLADQGAGWLSSLEYGAAERAAELPGGTYVFADADRLHVNPAFHAGRLHLRLSSRPDARCVNDPVRMRRRFELLRRLHRDGVNPIGIWRVEDRRLPTRWPVFLRAEDAPLRPASPVLASPEALFRAMAKVDAAGVYRPNLLLVELPPGVPGPERATGILRVGDRLLAGPAGERAVAEPTLRRFVERVLDLAAARYARLAVALDGDRAVVWDIDTHPTLVEDEIPADEIASALAALAG
ncbi:MAG: hypothetical protein AB7O45_17860 [Alphaproteobacteria bacterium]